MFIVQLSWAMAVAVLAEAGLSYLGFGAPVTEPSWGLLLAELQQYITVYPLSVLWPGLAITITVLGLNLLGDGLREATDPTLTRSTPRMAARAGGGRVSLEVQRPHDRHRRAPRRRRHLVRRVPTAHGWV